MDSRNFGEKGSNNEERKSKEGNDSNKHEEGFRVSSTNYSLSMKKNKEATVISIALPWNIPPDSAAMSRHNNNLDSLAFLLLIPRGSFLRPQHCREMPHPS